MKRQPSLHIKQDNLQKVLDQIFEVKDSPIKWDTALLAKEIVTGGRKYAATNRNLLVDTQKIAKRAKKIISAEDADVYDFAKMLILHRKQRKHQGIAIIKPGSKDWAYLKEVTQSAVRFCDEVGISKKDGFTYYISQCLDKVKKFSLPKLISLYSTICNEYLALKRIREDTHKTDTERAHDFYRRIVYEKIGYSEDYRKMPEKYIAFIEVVAITRKLNIRIEDYILAQFAGLEYQNSIPDPLQLYGDKANERLMKYLYSKGISIKDNRGKNIDWKKIKAIK